jgi:hypothetical protein
LIRAAENASSFDLVRAQQRVRMRKAHALCLTAVLAISALAICGNQATVVRQAEARWKPEFAGSPFRAWYEQQHDREGWSCCDRSDAHPVFDAYIKKGKWYVPINGSHHEIQPYQILDGPNPTGHSVVWYDGVGDHVTIFCFAPGPLY